MPIRIPRPEHEGDNRRSLADGRRQAATDVASSYPNPLTQFNSDESTLEDDGYAMNFTKGLWHNDAGILVENAHYDTLVEAINQALATDFTQVERGIAPSRLPKTRYSGDALDQEGEIPTWRGWESPRAGHYYSLQGPDADAVGMPPAPYLGSIELTAEVAEVYALALLRDNTFAEISTDTTASTPSGLSVNQIISTLEALEWYSDQPVASLSLQEKRRRAARFENHSEHDIDNPPESLIFERKCAFRGSTPGTKSGPYISQYMLQGTRMVRDTNDPDLYTDASISYGSQEIDQKNAFFPEAVDYMLHWNAYLDVQNGANFGAANITSPKNRRFIDTPRDLATYVRFDQLYQAYLNAGLFMLGSRIPFKMQQPIVNATSSLAGPGFPDRLIGDSRQGFATWGGPHILSLVTEVATRCLKAVRRQKYNYHRRARPERIGALMTLDAGALTETTAAASLTSDTRTALSDMRSTLDSMLSLVNAHNQSRRADTTARADRPLRADRAQTGSRAHADPHLINDADQLDPDNWDDTKNYLLPMAFAEGSPMHPSYGAGHATVAGGCVTMLKAFFHTVEADGSPALWPDALPVVCVEPGSEGQHLRDIKSTDNDLRTDPITIAGELNKLAANISIGRDMGGVHYYTDYYESIRMGERVTTGILIEHLSMIDEPIEMDFHSFDGDHVHLLKDNAGADVQVIITDSQGRFVHFDTWWIRHLPPSVPA